MSKLYKKWFFPFVLPAFAVFLIVVLIPFIIGIFYSFTGWRGSFFMGPNGRTTNPFEAFLGLKNYIAAFKQESFPLSLLVLGEIYGTCSNCSQCCCLGTSALGECYWEGCRNLSSNIFPTEFIRGSIFRVHLQQHFHKGFVW